ncbi:MAG: polysaccharide biosynthesis protein, partial [Bacillota bacterium]|nr:polysaccharide biosynthesis protein [Bacillota bacterium]
MRKIQNWKKAVLVVIDVLLINTAYFLAFFFRFEGKISKSSLSDYRGQALWITFIFILCFALFKLYRSLWAYAGIDEFIHGIEACTL